MALIPCAADGKLAAFDFLLVTNIKNFNCSRDIFCTSRGNNASWMQAGLLRCVEGCLRGLISGIGVEMHFSREELIQRGTLFKVSLHIRINITSGHQKLYR